MSKLNLNYIVGLLKEFSQKNKPLEVILIGGLSMEYYGLKERATIDIDAEVKGDINKLVQFFKKKHIPADLGEDISRRSLISLPPVYKERAITIYSDVNLKIKVLSPIDFIIAKIRRFTEQDLEDALFVARKYQLKVEDIQKAAKEATNNSPKDTAIFIFKKNVELFVDKLNKQKLGRKSERKYN